MTLTATPLLSRLHCRRAVNPAARYLTPAAAQFERWLTNKREETTCQARPNYYHADNAVSTSPTCDGGSGS